MKKILVANPFGLGDVIFSLFLVEALRSRFLDATIDFLGNERTEPLLRMDTSIRRVHTLDRDGLRRLWPQTPGAFWKTGSSLLSAIRQERYDVLFDLSLGREFSFYGALLGIRDRIGFDFKGRGVFLTKKLAIAGYEGRSVALQQLDLLPLIGLKAPELSGRLPLSISTAAQEAARFRLEEGGAKPHTFVAFAPGGGRSWGENAVYKQWNPERFAEIAARLSVRGIQTVFFGDETERSLLENIRSMAHVDSLICAGLPIEEVCALLKESRVLLANDGGLVHLASGLGVQTAAIFGPVDERVYGPFMPEAGSRIFSEPVPCRPCYSRFQFPPCGHARACLEELPVERVWSTLLEMV